MHDDDHDDDHDERYDYIRFTLRSGPWLGGGLVSEAMRRNTARINQSYQQHSGGVAASPSLAPFSPSSLLSPSPSPLSPLPPGRLRHQRRHRRRSRPPQRQGGSGTFLCGDHSTDHQLHLLLHLPASASAPATMRRGQGGGTAGGDDGA